MLCHDCSQVKYDVDTFHYLNRKSRILGLNYGTQNQSENRFKLL